MVNIKPQIVAALNEWPAVVAIFGGSIYHRYPPEKIPINCLTYYEIGNEPEIMGDETELVSRITIALDPYTQNSVSDAAQAIDDCMVALGGVRTDAPDDESEIPKQLKSMSYVFLVDSDGVIF